MVESRNFCRMTGSRASIVAGLLLLLLTATAAPGRAQTLLSQTTWGGADSEVVEGAAVAPDGSTYVVGNTRSFITNHGSIFLVKFAPDGATVAWQRVWESPGNFVPDDTAADVAVGPDGSVYVAGRT